MISWSPKSIEITKCCISFLEMLYQAFTAATFSFCLFVGLSASSFSYNNWKAALLGCDQVTDVVIKEYPFLYSEKLLGFIFIMPRGWTAVTSSVDTRRQFPLPAIHAHSITLPPPNHVVSLRSWVVFFSVPFSSHHSGTLSLVSTVSPLLWSNLSLLFLSVTSSYTLLLSLCIYLHEAVTWL